MERIICDICGSEYPADADRCPVCSYPRQGNEKSAAPVGSAGAERTKGGRFAEKNVKKRQKAQQTAKHAEPEGNPNKPLLIVIALLLVAIVLVSAYIVLRFFQGRDAYRPVQSTPQTTAPAQTTVAPEVPCAGILLDSQVVELLSSGQQHQIELTLVPEDTTDTPAFATDDPLVVTVSETGLLTAVGPGTATITITCGEAVRECTVICDMAEETTEAALEGELTLDRTDMSFFNPGESFTLQALIGETEADAARITWSSGDPQIATVADGHVVAVGAGTVTITAEYGGQSAECVVRCQFSED